MLIARITFGNVNKCSTEEEANTTPAATPTSSGEDEEAAGRNAASVTTVLNTKCISLISKPLFGVCPALSLFQVSPEVFEVPVNYHRRGGSRHTPMSNNDEELLQYAIHQSLLESRSATTQVIAIITQLAVISPRTNLLSFSHIFLILHFFASRAISHSFCLCHCRRGAGKMFVEIFLM